MTDTYLTLALTYDGDPLYVCVRSDGYYQIRFNGAPLERDTWHPWAARRKVWLTQDDDRQQAAMVPIIDAAFAELGYTPEQPLDNIP